MKIIIETNFIPLVHASTPPSGVARRIIPMRERRDISFEPVAQMILEFGKNVAYGVIAGWIFENIQKRRDKTYVKINGRDVPLDKAAIERALREDEEVREKEQCCYENPGDHSGD